MRYAQGRDVGNRRFHLALLCLIVHGTATLVGCDGGTSGTHPGNATSTHSSDSGTPSSSESLSSSSVDQVTTDSSESQDSADTKDASDPSSSSSTTTSLETTNSTLTSTVSQTTTATQTKPSKPVLQVDFQSSELGSYDKDAIAQDFPGLLWENAHGRAEIYKEGDNRFVRINYPKNRFGTGKDDGTGSIWATRLPEDYEELYVAYDVRLRAGFSFVKTGKMHGLAGGAANTGGTAPNGSDGWSSRLTWVRDGVASQYVYHADLEQNPPYGDNFRWKRDGKDLRMPTGEWFTVEHRVVMNTPGKKDGVIQGWFNGEQVLNVDGIRFRDVDSFAIDRFYFSTFFGGSTESFATTRDEWADFDNFVVSKTPITHRP